MRLNTAASASGGIIGRVVISCFFLVFFAAGAVFTVVLAKSAWADAKSRRWPSVECRIVESQVISPAQNDRDPTLRVKFEYRRNGQTYTSGRISLQSEERETKEAYRLIQQQYQPGARTVCYVDPRNPADAILERASPWSALLILFPLIFVTIGAGGILLTWTGSPATVEKRPLSDTGAPASLKQRRGLFFFFGIFLAAGIFATNALLVHPLLKIHQARAWRQLPCEIVSSRVRTHGDSDGDTYSVDIVYRYTYQERSYTANRYQFQGGSSSGHDSKARLVQQFPPGKRTFCYVNPEDPTDAVLERGYTAGLWFGLIPLVFVAVGAGGIIFSWRKGTAFVAAKEQPGGPSPALTLDFSAIADRLGPGELKPKTSRFGKLAGLIVMALFWNGIVSVFLYHVIAEWRRGDGPWFLTLFLTPFVAIGLGLVGGVGHALLAFFNPRPRLSVSDREIPLGGTLEVSWIMEGRSAVLANLHVVLEGTEQATYRRGTDTKRDTAVFATIEIARFASGPEIRAGCAKVRIPSDTMHSFQAKNNQVQWTLRVRGDIPRWPDLNEEFPLLVLPQPLRSLPLRPLA